MASSEQEGLIGYSPEPNYHESGTLEQNMCTELCSLAESSVQGHFGDKAREGQPPVCSETRSRQRQEEAGVALPGKGVPKFVPSSESLLIVEDCYLNSKVP